MFKAIHAQEDSRIGGSQGPRGRGEAASDAAAESR